MRVIKIHRINRYFTYSFKFSFPPGWRFKRLLLYIMEISVEMSNSSSAASMLPFDLTPFGIPDLERMNPEELDDFIKQLENSTE